MDGGKIVIAWKELKKAFFARDLLRGCRRASEGGKARLAREVEVEAES